MSKRVSKRKPKRKYVTTPASQARICWNNVRALCTNPSHPGHRYVGARGVTMHQPWADSFEAFVEGVGLPPDAGHTLKRLDREGHYSPGNVAWVPKNPDAVAGKVVLAPTRLESANG